VQENVFVRRPLTHPLIAGFHGKVPTNGKGKEIVVDTFVSNGSLADHLPSAKNSDMCQLQGETRVAIIVAGIVLAMRWVHSKSIIHRFLQPSAILLDWNWIVRLGDFRYGLIAGAERAEKEYPIPVGYAAPEYYEDICSTKNDVFSFGLILYELLAGEPAFPTEWARFRLIECINPYQTRPAVPAYVLRDVRELIYDCWSDDPNNRPSFDSILDWLEKHQFKLTLRVNSSKVSRFVEGIKAWEESQTMVNDATEENRADCEIRWSHASEND
jgi:serine/threonine protein kinase